MILKEIFCNQQEKIKNLKNYNALNFAKENGARSLFSVSSEKIVKSFCFLRDQNNLKVYKINEKKEKIEEADQLDLLIVSGYSKQQNPFKQQSTWYRVLGLAHKLCINNKAVLYSSVDQADLLIQLVRSRRPKIVFFHRVHYSEESIRIFNESKLVHAKTVLDLDDQLLATEVINEGLFKNFNQSQKNSFVDYVKAQQKFARLVDLVTVSTQNLLESAIICNSNSLVVQNLLPDFYTFYINEDISNEPMNDFRLYYGPGSLEHQIHFECIERQLYQFMSDYKNSTLTLGGGITVPKKFEKFGSRVIRRPPLFTEHYFTELRNYSVVLAPLKPDKFSQGKSWIKGLEALYMGVPWVGSKLNDYENLVKKYGVGITANEDEWYDSIKNIYESDSLKVKSKDWADKNKNKLLSSQNAHPLDESQSS